MSLEDSRQDTGVFREHDSWVGERGRYARRYAEGGKVVALSPDVAEAFPDSESVDEAPRALMDIANRSSAK